MITGSKDKTIKVWQLPLRWIDEQTKGRSEDLNPSDEDYNNFQHAGYQQDFKTGIDDSLWSESTLKKSSPSKIEEYKSSEESTSKQSNGSSGNITNMLSNTKLSPGKPADPSPPKSAPKPPIQSGKYEDDEDSDEEGLVGWNK